MPSRPLSAKQQRFAAEYLVDLNATQAAIRAGYSPRTAEWQGPQLLGKPHVAKAIEAGKTKLQAKIEVRQEDIVRELCRIAFGDRRALMTWGPNGVRLKDSSELSADEAAAVAEVAETTSKDGGSLRLKTHDKVKALELLGKHLGAFVERHEITGKDGQPLLPIIYMPANGRDQKT